MSEAGSSSSKANVMPEISRRKMCTLTPLPAKCSLCEFVSTDLWALYTHAFTHSDTECTCAICGHRCGARPLYDCHFLTFHIPDHRFCPICTFDTNDLQEFIAHVNGHQCPTVRGEDVFSGGHSTEVRTCLSCGKLYANIGDYTRHVQLVHIKGDTGEDYWQNRCPTVQPGVALSKHKATSEWRSLERIKVGRFLKSCKFRAPSHQQLPVLDRAQRGVH
jgi:ribosomal protein S27E